MYSLLHISKFILVLIGVP